MTCNIRFEGSTADGWVCEMRFPDDARPTHVFRSELRPTTDDAYDNLIDGLVFEIVELREIVAMAGA